YFATRLAELRAFLDKAQSGSHDFYMELQNLLGSPGAFAALPEGPDKAPWETAPLGPDSVLENLQFPNPVATVRQEDGSELFHVFYENGRLVFDEQDLIPFARKLATTPRFRAGDATAWALPGHKLDWERVQELLSTLISIRLLAPAS